MEPSTSQSYRLLPFRFARIESDRYVLTNLAGQPELIDRASLAALVRHELPPNSSLLRRLVSRHFVLPESSTSALHLLAAKYRTRQRHLPNLTALHLFVVTRRCTNACIYCQISRRDSAERKWDMSPETAKQAVAFMFQSPSPCLKVEFQGGEPLLNFPVVRLITEEAERLNAQEGRTLEFVICSNLTLLDEEHLAFFRAHHFQVSTSLDGPADIHDWHRPGKNGGAFDAVSSAIARCRETLGPHSVAALMTPSRRSLGRASDIVDEYLRQGFGSVFVRSLNPYGEARNLEGQLQMSTAEWLEFFSQALGRVLEFNRAGVPFREEYSAILLRRILHNDPGGFVDLQSPTGLGTAVLAYDHDGGIYASDEARMLSAMDDQTFRLGDLRSSSFADVIGAEPFLELLLSTMTEGMPSCSECAFQPYCGSDPIRHYRTQGDMIGHKALSEFCKKQLGVFGQLFRLMDEDPTVIPIFESWI